VALARDQQFWRDGFNAVEIELFVQISNASYAVKKSSKSYKLSTGYPQCRTLYAVRRIFPALGATFSRWLFD
jgi:hypothetical protein